MRAILSASRNPGRPVHAFAFPEFTTIARAVFRAAHFALTFTGGAQTLFVVNIPATVAGTSEMIRARSFLRPFSEPWPVPSLLISQKTAAALKPRGAQIEPGMVLKRFALDIAFSKHGRLERTQCQSGSDLACRGRRPSPTTLSIRKNFGEPPKSAREGACAPQNSAARSQ
jgi:hypothetical protein